MDSSISFIKKIRSNVVKRKFIETLQSEFAEGFLELLLNLMALMFSIDKEYRRNIENFDAKLTFRDKSGDITVTAIFKDEKLEVTDKLVKDVNATIIFKDQRTFMDFVFSPKNNALSTILNQSITFEGNLNYFSKFAYMATHLRLMITP